MQEYSELEQAYVVRLRHAHAWVRAYVGGAWRDIDTTPPQWFSIDAGEPSAFSMLSDLFSWAQYRASRAVAETGRDTRNRVLLGIALAFVAFLGWRLFRGMSPVASTGAAREPLERTAFCGADSELYEVEALTRRFGAGRAPAETWTEWLARAANLELFDPRLAQAALELHLRYRFDPTGISPVDRERLARVSRQLAAQLKVRSDRAG